MHRTCRHHWQLLRIVDDIHVSSGSLADASVLELCVAFERHLIG